MENLITTRESEFRGWRRWWKAFYGNLPDGEQPCPHCGGRRWIHPTGEPEVTTPCICAVQDWLPEIARDLLPYRSTYAGKFPLENIITKGLKVNDQRSTLADERMIKAVKLASKFILHPDTWLLLWGTSGNGKTHLLRAINEALWPIALYIEAPKLRTLIFDFDAWKNVHRHLFETCPILLVDDLGLQHEKQQDDYFLNTFTADVINPRCNYPDVRLTWVATNLNPAEEKGRSTQRMRLFDRLMDTEAAGYSAVLQLIHDSFRSNSHE